MKGRMSVARRSSIRILALLVTLGTAAAAQAQLSDADIQALRERGERGGWTFTVGRNEATEVPLSQLCGTVLPPDWARDVKFDPCLPQRDLPSRFDWRDDPAYRLYVRDQRSCGSCWAFAAIGVTEYAILRQDATTFDLSEQWLVSCNQEGYGCAAGGNHLVALEYLTQGGLTDSHGGNGPVHEDGFQYVAADVPCGQWGYVHPDDYKLDSWFGIGSSWGVPSPEQLKQAIKDHGPVAVTVYVNSAAWQAYHSGVFNACESAPVNHAVVLVGWDDAQGAEGVWILRNSWGSGWGEGGYMRIEYGCCRVGYAAAYVNRRTPDCNQNGTADRTDIANDTSRDCNEDSIPDECQPGGTLDCNGNSVPDLCDVYAGTSSDCDQNDIPDECDLVSGTADCNGNGVPDGCELNVAYQRDDGSNENAFCMSLDDPRTIWLNTFTVQAGGEEIDTIEVAWGYVPAGFKATLAIWNDPTNDGDPHDAQLLWRSSTPVTVTKPWTDVFASFPIPPIRVGDAGNIFFVGVYMNHGGTPPCDPYTYQNCYFPALVDYSVYPGHAWIAGGGNLENLADNPLPPENLDDYDGGAWLIRAHALNQDCNANGALDACDLASGASQDCNVNGVLDDCEASLLPVLSLQSDKVTVCDGTTATFKVEASGVGSLDYHWRKNGTPIDGATNSTYTIAAATPADAGSFDVVVESDCGSRTSPVVTLTVQTSGISGHPQSLTVNGGEPAALSVAASGPAPVTYQWRRNNQPLSGAVLPTYAVAEAALADAGTYEVVVTTPCGVLTSHSATLIVLPTAPLAPSPADKALRVNVDVPLAWSQALATSVYDVYFGTLANPPLVGSTPDATWAPGPLAYSTQYYWRVVARNAMGSVEGPVWTFRTRDQPPAAPAEPDPPDGAVGVPVDVVLGWGAGERATFYKVLIGTDPALKDARLLASTASGASGSVDLEAGTTYYWQVIAKNDVGIVPGPVWSFTTSPAVVEPNEPTDPNGGTPGGTDTSVPDDSGLDQPDTTDRTGTGLCPTVSASLVGLSLIGMWGARHGKGNPPRRRLCQQLGRGRCGSGGAGYA